MVSVCRSCCPGRFTKPVQHLIRSGANIPSIEPPRNALLSTFGSYSGSRMNTKLMTCVQCAQCMTFFLICKENCLSEPWPKISGRQMTLHCSWVRVANGRQNGHPNYFLLFSGTKLNSNPVNPKQDHRPHTRLGTQKMFPQQRVHVQNQLQNVQENRLH